MRTTVAAEIKKPELATYIVTSNKRVLRRFLFRSGSSSGSSYDPSGSGEEVQSCDLGDECPAGYSLYTYYGYTCTCKRDDGSAVYCTLSTTGKGWQMDKCSDVGNFLGKDIVVGNSDFKSVIKVHVKQFLAIVVGTIRTPAGTICSRD